LTGLYGCIQQWHGLFGFEVNWVMASEKRFGLIYINGNFRKFSTMSDPTGFSVVMASCAVFFLILAGNKRKTFNKLMLIIGSVIMLLGMIYTGTRTASVMAVGGIVMFVLLTFNKRKTRTFALFAGIIFAVLVYGPFYGNASLNRFRTSFIGSQDESYKVREMNRAFIQPYIYSHPIGGGLGTTGGSGLQYYPDHYLAGFPPDSGYLKKALETGWIGLILNCILYFTILKYGVTGMFRSKSRKRKLLYAAAVSAIFSFYIAEFAQEAIGQITDMVVYYPLIAILLRLRNFDQEKEQIPDTAI
jgi:cell division protein FtsW (lipid II flippase)